MRVMENDKFGKTHVSLESVILYLGPRGSQSRGTQRLFSVKYLFRKSKQRLEFYYLRTDNSVKQFKMTVPFI